MSANDPFFQFPLYCLGFEQDHKARLAHIISYCIVEVGNNRASKMTNRELRSLASKMTADARPEGLQKYNEQHLAIVAGMLTLHVKGGHVDGTIHRHKTMAKFCKEMEVKHGTPPSVRIRNDLLWDAHNKSMSYRRFAVLCAVYSVIGSKSCPVRITRDRIIAGAMGYKSVSMMNAEMESRHPDREPPLTENQVRRTLDELEGAGLFVRVQVSQRKVLFSHRMSREEMSAGILKSATRRSNEVRKHRQEDRQLQEAIRKLKQDNGLRGPHHNTTATSPQSNREVTALIESNLTESHLREADLTLHPAGECVSVSTDYPEGEIRQIPHPVEHAKTCGQTGIR